jgi:hypothetical protein
MSSAANPTPDRTVGGTSQGDTAPDRAVRRPVASAAERRNTRAVIAEQRERFGGMKFGACFFGWLTATGTAVLLTALVTAVGTGVGLGQNLTAGQASADAQTVGLVGAIVLLLIIAVAYFAGGYVAGRMARFNGVKQGVGVWLWAIIIAVVVAILAAIAGARFNILNRLNGFPRIPINEGTLTTGGIITAIVLVLAALVAAILGGMAGMRYHRRVDHATTLHAGD